MADRIPSLGDFSIPSGVFTTHEWVADAFIDTMGQACTLVYPAKTTECPNCYIDPRTNRSNGRYRAGGPVEFPTNTICPWCSGAGRSTANPTEDITLRVYWNPKDWVNIGVKIDAPDGVAQVIGYMSDLPKVERAGEIILDSGVQSTRKYVCIRKGEAVPWGFRHNRYFVQFVNRAGGG